MAAVLPFLPLTVQAQNTITNGLVAYWGLDGNFFDRIKAFHGTPQGSAPIEFVNGKTNFGKAIKLLGPSDSGGADQYVEITGGAPDDLAFASNSMSVSLWFTQDAWDKSWQAVCAKGESGNWRIHRRGGENGMAFTGGSAGDTPSGPTDVTGGAWHHLVAVKDAAADTEYLWIDGAIESQRDTEGPLAANGRRMFIGENPDARNRYWHGLVDDVAIWNRPLLENEITNLYAGGVGKPLSSFLPAVPTGTVTITQHPTNTAALEGSSVQFSVAVTYTGTQPPIYQWRTNGIDIPGAIAATYQTPVLTLADSGKIYSVKVTVPGAEATSNPATLTVSVDNVPPAVTKVTGSSSFNYATIIFSEPVTAASAGALTNYQSMGTPSLSITAVTVLNPTTVVLTTGTQTAGTNYTITIRNIKDISIAGNTMTNTQVTLRAFVFTVGLVAWERWQDMGGDTASLATFEGNLADPNFRPPDVTDVSLYFGSPRNTADNYGLKASGFFVPQVAGNYVFYLACDDQGDLFLSTDESPANKKRIANQPAWSDQYQWIDPDTTETQSDMYSASEWTPPNTITLMAGKRYYMEADFREGGGGDGLEVYYKLEGAPNPVNGTAPNTTGVTIGTYADPTGASTPLRITSVTLTGGNVVITYPSGTLQASPTLTSPTWADVTGASSPSYSTAPSGAARYFRLRQ